MLLFDFIMPRNKCFKKCKQIFDFLLRFGELCDILLPISKEHILLHLKNINKEELDAEATTEFFSVVQNEGGVL